MTDTKKRVAAACAIAAFAVAALASFWFAGRPLLELVCDPVRFREWVSARGALGRLAFVGMVALQVVVAVIPGEPFEIGAGYAFGAIEGTALCLLGSALGGAIIFGLVRALGVRAAEAFFSKEKINSLSFMRDSKKLNLLVFSVFLIPGSPKDLLSYCVGLTSMKLPAWLAISTIARIPSIITSTLGGDALGSGNGSLAIWIFAITLALSAAGLLAFNAYCRSQNDAAPAELKKAC